jgi:diacylglycerol kinase family enzyme
MSIDVGTVTYDGGSSRFVAHVVARRSWWHGPLLAVMNAQFIATWDVAPRSHPNDGWLDVVSVEASMPWRQRWAAWRRLPTASHVPHPQIATRRVRQARWDFDPAQDIYVDGRRVARSRFVEVELEPDGCRIFI